jgi:integrating conjugative element protein (TIGR03765 family)
MAWLPCNAMLAVVSACFGTAIAGPQVLADTGRTVSSIQYLVHVLDSSESDTETPLVSFPVRADGMSPGKLEDIHHAIDMPEWLTRPIFIVGNDPVSSQWLAENHAALLSYGAAGIVISVEDVSAFKSLRRASSLPMVPHPAPHLIRLLQANGINRYPFLLLEHGDVLQDLRGQVPAGRDIGSGR